MMVVAATCSLDRASFSDGGERDEVERAGSMSAARKVSGAAATSLDRAGCDISRQFRR